MSRSSLSLGTKCEVALCALKGTAMGYLWMAQLTYLANNPKIVCPAFPCMLVQI